MNYKMSKPVKFCPECGADMENNVICSKCGYDSTKSESKPTPSETTSAPSPQEFSSWKSLEPYVEIVGKYAWIILIIAPIILLFYSLAAIGIFSVYGLGGYVAGQLAWIIIEVVVVILFAIFWVKPKFSDRCASKQWDILLDDTLKISTIQIPWMLIVGVLIEIFGNGWVGLFVLGPAIILIFFGPRTPYNWQI